MDMSAQVPSVWRLRTLSGKRLSTASSAPAVRSRMRSSSQRPVSKKNTNMVNESKKTSTPKGPWGSKVPSVLTTKVTTMPSATGKSMLIWRSRRSRQALLKNGVHEKSITGKDSTQDAQRSKCTASSEISPGCVRYVGVAYIMTCIMHRAATAQRQTMRRASSRLRAWAWASFAGKAL